MLEPFVVDTIRMIQNIGENMNNIGLRDLFAMNAMNSIIGNHTLSNLDDIYSDIKHEKVIPTDYNNCTETEEKLTTREWIARASYLMADAMMQARKNKN